MQDEKAFSGNAGRLAESEFQELSYSTLDVFNDFLAGSRCAQSAGECLHRVLERAASAAQLEDTGGGLVYSEDLSTFGVQEEERVLLLLDHDTGHCSWKDQDALSW
nr:hypothetical protein [Pyxidicoccus trucidator]